MQASQCAREIRGAVITAAGATVLPFGG